MPNIVGFQARSITIPQVTAEAFQESNFAFQTIAGQGGTVTPTGRIVYVAGFICSVGSMMGRL
jgi:hypothetical protein